PLAAFTLRFASIASDPSDKTLPDQLVDQAICMIDARQAFAQDAHADRDRAIDRRVETVVAAEIVDIAVEYQPDDFRILVDERRAGIATDDVGAGDEVERLLRVQCRPRRDPARRQLERGSSGGAFV